MEWAPTEEGAEKNELCCVLHMVSMLWRNRPREIPAHRILSLGWSHSKAATQKGMRVWSCAQETCKGWRIDVHCDDTCNASLCL